CEAVVPSQSVSRVHASIQPTKNGWTIHDLGSRNGLFINEKRLEPHASQLLPTGASITLGKKVRLCFLDSASLYFSVLSPSDDKKKSLDLDQSAQFFAGYKNTSEEFSLQEFIDKSADYGFQDFLQHFKTPVLVRLQSDILDESSSGEQTGKLRRMTPNLFAKGAFWTLGEEKPELTMGRDIQNDIILGGSRVSRRHACLKQSEGKWEVENLSTSEKVKVRDQSIEDACSLFDEDFIRLGRSCLLQFMTPTSFWKFTRMYLKITNF
ncbi:MAG: FHA domain-containing protein, partial [Planctomycetota bacterium]|nr:FHA domain-containing protein [Planctomycetota bacterium]